MTVSFTNQVHIIGMILYMLWYTVHVPNEGRTSLVGPRSHGRPGEDMSAPLTSLCCCVCGKALPLLFVKSLNSLRCRV